MKSRLTLMSHLILMSLLTLVFQHTLLSALTLMSSLVGLRRRDRGVVEGTYLGGRGEWWRLEVLLALTLQVYGVQDRLPLAGVARAQRVDLRLHLRVQPRHARLQVTYGQVS